MKKAILLIVICILLTTGCAQKESINIDKWMFDPKLGKEEVVNKLGVKSNTSDIFPLDNWELLNDISGTLSFEIIEQNNPELECTHWDFSTAMNESKYNTIHEYLKDNFTELEKRHQTQTPNGIECIFMTTYDAPKQNNDDYDAVYSIILRSNDDTITLEWGSTKSPKKHLNQN